MSETGERYRSDGFRDPRALDMQYIQRKKETEDQLLRRCPGIFFNKPIPAAKQG